MLSAIVITRNETANIKRCLDSLAFADEIIVVDSGSTDNTVELARELGAKVFENEWEGYGAQKNFAAEKASGDWLLYIDADEEVLTALRESISSTINGVAAEYDFYWLRIVTVFLGKPLLHLYGHNARLFRKSAGHWTSAVVHEQVTTNDGHLISLGDDKSGLLDVSLLHYSHRTVSSYIGKMHHYTSLDAEQMHLTKKHRSGRDIKSSFLLPYRLSIRQFVKLLIYRRGLLDGMAGILWCALSAYYEYEMAKKYLVLSR